MTNDTDALDLPKLHKPWVRHQITGDGRVTFCAVNWDTAEVIVEALMVKTGETWERTAVSPEDERRAVLSVVYWIRDERRAAQGLPTVRGRGRRLPRDAPPRRLVGHGMTPLEKGVARFAQAIVKDLKPTDFLFSFEADGGGWDVYRWQRRGLRGQIAIMIRGTQPNRHVEVGYMKTGMKSLEEIKRYIQTNAVS